MNIVGFVLAGGALLLLSEVQPELALGTLGLVLLGSILANPQSLNNIAALFASGNTQATK